jgi:HEAT repeat protein
MPLSSALFFVVFISFFLIAAGKDLQEAKGAFERGDYTRALKILDETFTVTGERRSADYELRAVINAHLGRTEDALADYDHAVKLTNTQQPETLRRIAIGVLSSLLSHDQERVRGAAVTALAELGSRGTEPALSKALKDPSPRVRSLAIQSAGRLGLAARQPAVREAVGDPDGAVRLAALATLGLSKASAVAAFQRRLQSSRSCAKDYAIKTSLSNWSHAKPYSI